MKIEFVHTNLIAYDWRRLADFYFKVFRCKPAGPERDLSGDWVTKLTGIDNATIRGIHLKLPGQSCQNITLEIFEYDPKGSQIEQTGINTGGYGHIAFLTDDFDGLVSQVIENGGQYYGEPVYAHIEGLGIMHVAYMIDPEGNVIEIQERKL